jgi:hypothetical protein
MTEILQFTFEKSKFTKILSKNLTTGLRSNITKVTEKWYVWKSPPPNLDPLVAGPGLHQTLLIRRTSQDPSTSLNQIR